MVVHADDEFLDTWFAREPVEKIVLKERKHFLVVVDGFDHGSVAGVEMTRTELC